VNRSIGSLRYNGLDRHVSMINEYSISSHRIEDDKLKRFYRTYSVESAKMVRLKDNIFVSLNSMAFEGDRCDMCQEAMQSLNIIAGTLDCAKVNLLCSDINDFLFLENIAFDNSLCSVGVLHNR